MAQTYIWDHDNVTLERYLRNEGREQRQQNIEQNNILDQ